jgi:hypothetical protein
MSRRRIIAAFGGRGDNGAGVLGGVVARLDAILLTGGHPHPSAGEEGETKYAAMLGASKADPNARLLGILPSGASNQGQPTDRTFFLMTGLSSEVRNVINGFTPDVVVAFAGGRGTLAEIAFALAADRPVLFAPGSLGELRKKFRQRAEGEANRASIYETHFRKPAEAYSEIRRLADFDGLLALLHDKLKVATETENLRAALKEAVGEQTRTSEPTGFPGLPGVASSKQQFEDLIVRISA